MSESPDRLSAATDHEVRSVIECYRDRFNDGDADGLAQIYTSDISFVNLGGVPFAGRDAIREQQANGFRGPLDRTCVRGAFVICRTP